jgi:hypothetical protein
MRYYFLVAIGGATAIMLLFYFADQGVLGMAAKYAEDEPNLIKFMSDMGYSKTGEWCGEFAASVIKRAGGTPPSGAGREDHDRARGQFGMATRSLKAAGSNLTYGIAPL